MSTVTMLGTVDQGTLARVLNDFTDPNNDGAAVDPSPLTATVLAVTPNTTTVYTYGGTNPQDALFTKISTGHYLLLIDTSSSGGRYKVRFKTPNGHQYQFSEQFEFSVDADTL